MRAVPTAISPHGSGFKLKSAAMRRVYDELAKYAEHGRNCILFGPSGAGKEFAARYYHEMFAATHQQAAPFVPLNCACLPPNLALSELFGHTDQAFTGVKRARAGLWFEAREGVLFLDEVGDLAIEAQAYLLRAMDPHYGAARPLGANKEKDTTGVLVVGATEKSPRELRPALLARFDKQVFIPGLDDRPEEIEEAVHHFLLRAITKCRDQDRLLALEGGPREHPRAKFPAAHRLARDLAHPLLPLVRARSWPLNFRALGNALDAAVVCADRCESVPTFAEEVARRFNEQAGRYSQPRADRAAELPPEPTIAPAKAPANLIRQISDALPQSARRATEAMILAQFVHAHCLIPFNREELQSALPRRLGARAVQNRLADLVRSGVLTRLGRRGDLYCHQNASAPVESAVSPVRLGELALPEIASDPTAESAAEHVDRLLQRSRAVFISDAAPERRTRTVAALGRRLRTHRPVWYFSFSHSGMAELLLAIEHHALAGDLAGLQSVAAGLSDLLGRAAFCSGYLHASLTGAADPVLILDGLDALRGLAEPVIAASLVRLWPDCMFVVTGTKLGNDLQIASGSNFIETAI